MAALRFERPLERETEFRALFRKLYALNPATALAIAAELKRAAEKRTQ